MKKGYVIFAAAVLMSASAYPQGKPCEELKSDIAKKLEANGVKSYSLEILAKDKETQGKVIGTCAGGTKKIVYTRTETSAPRTTGTGMR
jgi:hypothetical protein